MAMRRIKSRDEPWRGSPKIWAKLMNAFRNGTERQIAKRYNVTLSRVRHLAYFYGISRKGIPVRKQLELFEP